MRVDTLFYHGTPVPGITRFELGVRHTGEMDEPIDGIWLGTSINGARYHAVQVAGRIREAKEVHIYECRLASNTVIADAKRNRMPPKAFKRFVELYMPWYRRCAYRLGGMCRKKFAHNHQWYRWVYLAAMARKKSDDHNGSHNAVIEVCRNIGIDVLGHPSTSLYGDSLAHWDESVYGETALLLNCEKAVPILKQTILLDD